MKKKKVLFLCTHNSCRSQMAEGFLNHLCKYNYKAFSAGIKKTHVNPYVIEVMGEIGIDISDHRSKTIDEFKDTYFDIVVTVCDHAREVCPFFPGKKVIHKGFKDPSEEGNNDKILNRFRKTRDEIKTWIKYEF